MLLCGEINIMVNSIILELGNFFKEAASQYPIEMVFLYGSFAGGFPRVDSDIDLAVVFSDKIIDDSEKIHYLITEITYQLTLKLNKEVNIIVVDKDFSHPMLYYNAVILGVPVFIKDSDKFLDLKLEAIYQMEDFQIFGIRWQREIARRNIEEVSNA